MDHINGSELSSIEPLMNAFAKFYSETGSGLRLEPWERDLEGMGFGANPSLSTCTRAFREVDGWKMFLLLTPWRLVRILIPPPDHEEMAQWLEQANPSSASALGLLVRLNVQGSPRKVHIQFDERLGLHFMEPLVMNMSGYCNNEELFAAHERVIVTRDSIMKKTGRSCTTQTEISRRELFSPLMKLGRPE